jgi:hypothetical protein
MNILGVVTNRGDAMVVGLFVQVVSDFSFVFSDQLAQEDHSCTDNAVLLPPVAILDTCELSSTCVSCS